MDPLDPVTALERLGGVTDGTTMRRVCDPWQVRVAVSEGRVVHLGRNSYALPGADEAFAVTARLRGVVSHLSAARAWGWKVKRMPTQPVVTVPRHRRLDGARRTGVDVRYADLPTSAVHRTRTTRVRTVVDCARSLPFDEALAVADSALREGIVTRAQLVEAAQQSPRTGRSRALRVIEHADGRAANPFESCLRAIALEVAGLTVTPQLPVPGIGHADVGDRAVRLVIEADSYEFHSEREAFRYDIRRYTAMVRAGWLVLRFCWEDVMQRPELVRDTMADVVALRRQAGRRCPTCPAA
jgi:very-short-patch-repair endonuclease